VIDDEICLITFTTKQARNLDKFSINSELIGNTAAAITAFFRVLSVHRYKPDNG